MDQAKTASEVCAEFLSFYAQDFIEVATSLEKLGKMSWEEFLSFYAQDFIEVRGEVISGVNI